MNRNLYEEWIQSRRVEPTDLNIADAVMEQLAQKADQPGILQRTREVFWLDIVGARGWMRMCAFALGALMGLLRMVLQVYSLLFA